MAASYRVIALSKRQNGQAYEPLVNVTVEAVDASTISVSGATRATNDSIVSTATTNEGGEAVFSAITGTQGRHLFRARTPLDYTIQIVQGYTIGTAPAITQIDLGDAAALGSGPGVAYIDHQHPVNVSSDEPNQIIGSTGTTGTSAALAHQDHVHNHGTNYLPDAHHAKVHALIDATNHPETGLTAGHVVKATSSTAYSFGQLLHSQLGSVGANDHHNANHALIDGTGHSVSGLTIGHTIVATSSTGYGFQALAHSQLGSVSADQHHTQAHGDSDHNNVERNLFIPAGAFAAVIGTPTLGTDFNARYECWLLDDAAAEYVATTLVMPNDYVASSTISVDIWHAAFAAQTTDSVRINQLSGNVSEAEAAGNFDNNTTDTLGVYDTRELAHKSTHSVGITTYVAGDLLRIRIGRVSTEGTDTVTGDWEFFGINLRYTAAG